MSTHNICFCRIIRKSMLNIMDRDDFLELLVLSLLITTKNMLLFQRVILFSPLDKSVLLKSNFLVSQPKHVLWVLKRTVSMRRFS